MVDIQYNTSLLPYNTFGIDVKAAQFVSCLTIDDIKEVITLIHDQNLPYLVIGGGSNLVFTQDFDGLIIYPKLDGISTVKQDQQHVWIEAGAGVVWDDLVAYTVNKNLHGLENLSYIPGHVGASPIQNIGAYGIEAKDSIEVVNGIYIDNKQSFTLTNDDCEFDYRNSIFKNKLKNKTIVTSVIFKLAKKTTFNLSYGNVLEEVEKLGEINLSNIRNAIIEIRKSKLPNPEVNGNAGSFFKNPIITKALYTKILHNYPTLPSYPIDDHFIKIPAGWLIETAGWKGQSRGQVAVHDKQALVLINKGLATGKDVFQLAQVIITDIKNKFEIELEAEVNMIGS